MINFVHREHKDRVAKAKRGPRRKVTRTYTRISRLSNQMSKAVQVNFVKGIRTFKKSISKQKLLDAWKTGSYGHVMEVLPWQQLHTDLDGIKPPLQETIISTAHFAIPALPAPVQARLRYDTKNPRIEGYLEKRTGELITNINLNTQHIVQGAIRQSFDRALTPDRVADMIKGSIGLLPKHAIAVENYRAGLEQGAMAPDKIATLVAGYQDRLLDYRAMMIARTETRFATNQGQLDIWRHAADQDLIDARQARKVWVVDGDPCEICEPMDGVAVGLNESWSLENGDVVDIPTESHPHCMCGMELEFGEVAQDETDSGDATEDNSTEDGDES